MSVFNNIYREEAQEYIDMGSINSLFVLGRSIGFIGKYAFLTDIIISNLSFRQIVFDSTNFLLNRKLLPEFVKFIYDFRDAILFGLILLSHRLLMIRTYSSLYFSFSFVNLYAEKKNDLESTKSDPFHTHATLNMSPLFHDFCRIPIW